MDNGRVQQEQTCIQSQQETDKKEKLVRRFHSRWCNTEVFAKIMASHPHWILSGPSYSFIFQPN